MEKKVPSDRSVIDSIHAEFGYQWFSARSAKVTKGRLDALTAKGRLEKIKDTYCSTVYYRIKP